MTAYGMKTSDVRSILEAAVEDSNVSSFSSKGRTNIWIADYFGKEET